MARSWWLYATVLALVSAIACVAQDETAVGVQRQTKLVLPQAQPGAIPELAVLPAAVHRYPPDSVAFSRDGRTLATCSRREALVWDLAGRLARCAIPYPESLAATVALSPDGRLAAIAAGFRLSVWDTRESRMVAEWGVGNVASDGACAAFSPDGRLVALPAEYRTESGEGSPRLAGVDVWEARTGRLVASLTTDTPMGSSALECVAFRPDGVLAAALHVSEPVDVRAFPLVGRSAGETLAAIGIKCDHACFSVDGQYLIESGTLHDALLNDVPFCRLRSTRDGSVLLQKQFDWGEVLAGSDRHAVLQVRLPSANLCTYLVDLQTGASRTFYSPCAAFSPDATLLATPSVLDVETGRTLLTVPVLPLRPEDAERACFFVADERSVVSCLWPGGTVASRPVGGESLREPPLSLSSMQHVYHDSFVCAWLGPDGLHVVPTGRPEGRRSGFVPREADGSAERLTTLDARTDPLRPAPAVGLQDDGTVLVAGHSAQGDFTITAYAPDATVVTITRGQLAEAGRLHSPSGDVVPRDGDWVSPAFSPDARKLLFFYVADVGNPRTGRPLMAAVLDLPTATVTATFPVGQSPPDPLDARRFGYFLADGKTVVVDADGSYDPALHPQAHTRRGVATFDSETGRRTFGWPLQGEIARASVDLGLLAASPDGSWIATREVHPDPLVGGWAGVHDRQSGRLAGMVPPRRDALVVSADFRSDGDRLTLTYSDGLTTLWDLAPLRSEGDAQLLGTLLDWPNGEWATVTPQGYVDCSPGGTRVLAWRLGESLYPFEQFAAKYRRPDLVRRALAGEDISAERSLSGADVPPTAAFLRPGYDATIEGEAVTVEVEVAGVRPLARVDLLIDGRPIPDELAATAKWEQIGENHGVYTFELALSQYQRRTRLQAVVHDEEGLQSMPAEVTFTRAGAPPPATVLHALSVGVSVYRNEEWNNLKYADKDAESFAKVAGEGAARKVLLNENATASNVRFALEEMKASVTEDDVVAIFLAGHGAVDAAGNYYMLLHDSDVTDIENSALPWDDFVSALKSIRAKLVMVFADTCHSGSITGQESVNTLIDRLNRKAGVVVFTASRGDEASIEREDWGHGAFTKALLEGFSGEADTYPKDKQVSLAELRDYVIQRVKELTSGRQHPYLPRLEEFDPARPIANVLSDLR